MHTRNLERGVGAMTLQYFSRLRTYFFFFATELNFLILMVDFAPPPHVVGHLRLCPDVFIKACQVTIYIIALFKIHFRFYKHWNKLAQAIAHLTCIREESTSSFGRGTDYLQSSRDFPQHHQTYVGTARSGRPRPLSHPSQSIIHYPT